MNKTNPAHPNRSSKPKKKLKYKFVKSVVSQYIKGQIQACDIFGKQKRSTCDKPASSSKAHHEVARHNAESIIFQKCPTPGAAKKRPKFVHPNVELCAPDILCLNFTSPRADSRMSRDKRSALAMELKELKRISAGNEMEIAKMLNKLNELRLSISLLSEEQQRLEHSREIRTIGLKLLNNMIRGKYEDGKETAGRHEQYEREKQIIEKILEQLARLEKVKMKLEYENIRNLYTIKKLKKQNAELEKINAGLHKELNSADERTYSSFLFVERNIY